MMVYWFISELVHSIGPQMIYCASNKCNWSLVNYVAIRYWAWSTSWRKRSQPPLSHLAIGLKKKWHHDSWKKYQPLFSLFFLFFFFFFLIFFTIYDKSHLNIWWYLTGMRSIHFKRWSSSITFELATQQLLTDSVTFSMFHGIWHSGPSV